MPTAKAKTLAELEAQKKAIKEAAAAEIAAVRKALAEKTAALYGLNIAVKKPESDAEQD